MGAADEVEVVLVQELLRRRIGRGKHLRTETRETRHNHTRTRIGRGGDLRDGGAEIRHGDSRSGAEIRYTEICRLGAEIRETEIRDRAPRSDPAVRRHAEMRDAPARGHGRGEDRGGRHTPARNSVETGASFTRSSIPRLLELRISHHAGGERRRRATTSQQGPFHTEFDSADPPRVAHLVPNAGERPAPPRKSAETQGGAEQGPLHQGAPNKGLSARRRRSRALFTRGRRRGAPRGAGRKRASPLARRRPPDTAAVFPLWGGDTAVPRHGARTATAAQACGHSKRAETASARKTRRSVPCCHRPPATPRGRARQHNMRAGPI